MMPGSDGTSGFQELIGALSGVQSIQWTMVAGQVIYFYDIILTAKDEYKYVWKAEWGLGKTLYLLNRYPFNLFHFFYTVLSNTAPTSWLTLSFCKYMVKIFMGFGWVHFLVLQTILSLRTTALYSFNPSIVILVSSMVLLSLGSVLVMTILMCSRMTIGGAIPGSPFFGCTATCLGCLTLSRMSLIPFLFLDTVLLVLTLFKYHRDSTFLGKKKSYLLKVLYRDGFVYFAVIILCTIVNSVAHLTLRPSLMLLLDPLVLNIVSVMSSRLLLNLRSAYFRPPSHQTTLPPNVHPKRLEASGNSGSTGVGVWNVPISGLSGHIGATVSRTSQVTESTSSANKSKIESSPALR